MKWLYVFVALFLAVNAQENFCATDIAGNCNGLIGKWCCFSLSLSISPCVYDISYDVVKLRRKIHQKWGYVLWLIYYWFIFLLQKQKHFIWIVISCVFTSIFFFNDINGHLIKNCFFVWNLFFSCCRQHCQL